MACSTPPTYWPTGIQSLIFCGIERALGVLRGDEAQEVPGRIHEGVHGVRVPLGRAVAVGALDVDPVFGGGQRRGALRGQVLAAQVRRQCHGQLLVRDRHLAAGGAVDDRDRRTPEALPAEQPVAQAEVHELLARALLLAGSRWRPGWPRLLGSPSSAPELISVPSPAGRRAGDGRVLLAGVQHRAHGQVERPWRSRGRAGRGPGRP